MNLQNESFYKINSCFLVELNYKYKNDIEILCDRFIIKCKITLIC